ncbi:LacI family DNA-binding transcriptional regulator [Levilactobacillus bambusae]|uniref:Uncharacterized protein n=1 Tax=Levilactobacillus bambusae TaxID=2024736 RepID=A0A2V1MYY8_9LACO|nr:LacI family DNA-binding transcriptional regulator [Levilactobacillus bambusae]PWG00177.1 hypothetical protein DCM90_04385 [Levilactobacillus bambusae]
MKSLTISDVAKAAGVSKTTLSRFLNGNYSHMSEATRQRIAQVVADLNYRPNRQAQALKSKHSHLLGIVVADMSNMYSTQLITGISRLARQEGYQLMMMSSDNSEAIEHDNLNRLLDQSVDGIIMQPTQRDSASYDFLMSQVPLVLVDRQTEPLTWPTVSSDNYFSTKQLATLIKQAEYQHIVVVSEPIHEVTTREQRFNGIQAVTNEFGLSLDLVEVHDSNPEVLHSDLLAYTTQKTAIVALNGRTLSLVLKMLIRNHVLIPDTVGVCGYDDWNWTELVGPGITSIEQDPTQIGVTAAELLLQEIRNGKQAIQNVVLPAELKNRHSL